MKSIEPIILCLLVIAAGQYVITALLLAALCLGLWCLYRRPAETITLMTLCFALNLLAQHPLIALGVAAAGAVLWLLVAWLETRRHRPRAVGRLPRGLPRPEVQPRH